MEEKKYVSDVAATVHEFMDDIYRAGGIDKKTMRWFDERCLTTVRPLEAAEIKAIRKRERVSQTVFANYLNVTTSIVSQWERGEKKPSGAALKLLSLVDRKGLDAVA